MWSFSPVEGLTTGLPSPHPLTPPPHPSTTPPLLNTQGRAVVLVTSPPPPPIIENLSYDPVVNQTTVHHSHFFFSLPFSVGQVDCFWRNDSHLYNNVLCGEILDMIATNMIHFEKTTFSINFAENLLYSKMIEILGMKTEHSKMK